MDWVCIKLMRLASTYAETTVINQVGSQAENPGNYSDGPHASLLKYTDVSKRVVKGTGEFAKNCLYEEKT